MLTPLRWSSGQFEDGLVRVAQDGDSVIGFAVLLAPVTVAALAAPRTLLAAEATAEKPPNQAIRRLLPDPLPTSNSAETSTSTFAGTFKPSDGLEPF
jgi:hypothetical protein